MTKRKTIWDHKVFNYNKNKYTSIYKTKGRSI